MALTSQQKHYIKKNIKKLPSYQIASDLGLRQSQVEDFIKKHLGRDKYEKLVTTRDPQRYKNSRGADLTDFQFLSFVAGNIGYFILLFVLVAIVYFNSLGNAFVSDDIATIAKNQDIGKISAVFNAGLMGFFDNFITFATYKLFGLNPTAYRVSNILFHLTSVFSIFTLFNMLGKKRVAIFTSVIFAVHPLLIESIAWIAGGPYVRYGCFFLLSFILYLLSRSKPSKLYYPLSIFFLFMALISSEKSMSLFVIFPLYELVFGNFRKNWKRTLPYIIVSLAVMSVFASAVVGRVSALNTQYYEDANGFYNPLVQVPVAVVSYLILIFWPDKLTLYHTEMQFSPVQYVLCLIVFLTLLGLIYYGWKKNKWMFFWLAFFLIALSPTLTPIKVGWVVAERYSYIATLGIITSLALLADWLIEKNEEYKTVYYSILGIIVIALGTRTIVRNIDWKNEDNLWMATAKVSPSGAPIHNNLGDVYARHGDYPKAIEEFTKSTQINPRNADAYHNLANTYQMTNQLDKAEENYKKSTQLNPNLWQSYQNLASLYFGQGKYDLAQQNIQKALAINPNDSTLQTNAQMIQNQASGTTGATSPQ